MSVFANLDTMEFVQSGEVTIEDFDSDWIRLNIENVTPEHVDHYLNAILQYIRKSVNMRIRILKSATNVIFNLPYRP
ncbi:MAG: hypothetical protein ACFFCD_14275 [Promethearchaeota archaeon]